MLRVVALSGGYSREEANDRLARNNGVIASFSRALTEGLSAQQSDEEFDATLDASIRQHLRGLAHLARTGSKKKKKKKRGGGAGDRVHMVVATTMTTRSSEGGHVARLIA